ncbi:galactokinase [Dyadobacter fermentans]|uniref:Galactokinase n=1 Tax=Dyadobacter fermentans (strain ATCC 700827 / DSM 18053 / CIP 107007 / KCTC 52180 / NS114) TaxID=471854 RepID=C6W4D3_DYAFD|nr:galactokinase [Dyadobacter fermentans]ACT94034.1 galactokinase [Dyadobacter fermentans DSM 18053]
MLTTETDIAEGIQDKYFLKFGTATRETVRVFRSPGRINLIGEHTDYNNGFVLPASVDKAVYFVIAPREDDQVILYAADLDQTYAFSLDDLSKPEKSWPHYQIGIVEQIQKKGLKIGGFQAAFGGNVPVGAGLSSSAALECCLLFALNEIYGLNLDRFSIVKMSQKSENEYVGVQCGIMDQFASAFGKEESVIRLDCRSLEYEYFPFPMDDYLIVLCDTMVKHSLASSEYNTRRQECEKGTAILQQYDANVLSLRDATPALVEEHQDEMGDVVYRRCKFITEEIQRVQDACDLLVQGNLPDFGKKMYDTHFGLQDEYEVSCPELDFLVAQTLDDDSVLGARMMGGGFGGCTINLVKKEGVDAFEAKMKQAYLEKYQIDLPCYRVKITDGTEEVALA